MSQAEDRKGVVGSLLDNLAAVVGDRHVIAAGSDQESCVVDWRGRCRGRACAVVKPGSTQEVAAVVKLCAGQGIAIILQGGNTGMCGAATPSDSERNVVVRMDRMRSIRNVNSLANSITVDAGCILAEVQAAAAAVDRYFPLSLDRVRDRNAVNGMLGEVAGKAVADANVSETARVQKKIIHDCLKGEERGKIES